jgi:hypothetical protein
MFTKKMKNFGKNHPKFLSPEQHEKLIYQAKNARREAPREKIGFSEIGLGSYRAR